MKDKEIQDELKKRSSPTYHVIKDPETGVERWVEDTSALSFSYDTKELEYWIQAGGIPQDLAAFGLKEFEETFKKIVASKEMVARFKKEGREPTMDDWLQFAQQYPETLENIHKKIAFHKFILDNRETLLKLLQQPTQKKRKFRQSGHFVDQKLKTSFPGKQPTIFDILSVETKEKIDQQGVKVRTEGIRLTAPQDKLMTALMRLLHEKSETRNEKSPQFYSGNLEAQIVPYGGEGQESKSAMIRIYPSELYKAYLDSDDYSGADIKFIKALLHDTEQQKFLIIYERKYDISTEKGAKKSRTDRIEDFQSLFKIIRFFEGLTDEEKKELDNGNEEIRERRGELIIAFNPLLTDQINSKYVEYPEDINRQTVIAAGGHSKVTDSIIALRDYLMREISSKRTISEINEDKLVYLLKLDNYAKEGRKKRIETRISAAIQAAKNLGLISHHERIIGAAGQWKYVFHLKPNVE